MIILRRRALPVRLWEHYRELRMLGVSVGQSVRLVWWIAARRVR